MKRQHPFLPSPARHSSHSRTSFQRTTKSNSKSAENCKRKSNSCTFQLPNIPGIPVDLLPLHLQCLRACQDFAQGVYDSTPFLPPSSLNQEELDTRQTSSDTNIITHSTNVLDSVFQRMDSAASQNNANNQQQRAADCDTLRQRKDNMVSLWLRSIHRHVRNDTNQSSKRDSTKQNSKREPVDVPTAVARHLMLLLLSPPPSSKQTRARTISLSTQRASTYMLHLLLQKSSTARNYFCSATFYKNNSDSASFSQQRGDNCHSHTHTLWIVAWMDQLQHPQPSCRATFTESLQPQWDLLHCESYGLVKYLHRAFGHCYPILDVAVQRLQGQHSSLDKKAIGATTYCISASSKPPDAAEYRRLRDMAMQCIEVEERKVSKLLQKAYQCIDLLVPRLVTGEVEAAVVVSGQTKSFKTIDPKGPLEMADGDIDWEDGAEDDLNDVISHLQAVEYTMTAMKTIGGQLLIQKDELAIDFGADLHEEQHRTSNTLSKDAPQDLDVAAKMKLRAIVESFQTKHVPRLSAWEIGLAEADNLIAKAANPTALSEMISREEVLSTVTVTLNIPLVRMSSQQLKLRNNAVSRIVDLQRQISAVVSSALRLGVIQNMP